MCQFYYHRAAWKQCVCAWNAKIVTPNSHWPPTVSTVASTITRSSLYSVKMTKRNYGIEVWCVNCCKTTIENWKQFCARIMQFQRKHRLQRVVWQRQQVRRQGKWVLTKMVLIMCAKYANDCTCMRRAWCVTWKHIKVMIGRTNWHRTADVRPMLKSRADWRWWNVPIAIDCSAIWLQCKSIESKSITTPIHSPNDSLQLYWIRCSSVSSVIFCTTTKWPCSSMSPAMILPLVSSAPGATLVASHWWRYCSIDNPNVRRVCTNERNASTWKHHSCATNAWGNSKRKRNCSSTGDARECVAWRGKVAIWNKFFFYSCRYTTNHFLALYNQRDARNEFMCEKCGQAFMTTVELIQHSDEYHIKKRKPTELTTESNSSRPYLCDICGKGYTQSSHLYQHLRFHKGNDCPLYSMPSY